MGHAVSDTIKIVLVVIAPLLFFAVLVTLAFLYRRYRSPHFGQHCEPSTPTWARSNRDVSPKAQCQTCDDHHQIIRPHSLVQMQETGGKFGTTGEFGSSSNSSSTKVWEGNISQPHFEERPISIRRISSNPYGVDEIQRLNSLSSTLTSEPGKNSVAASSSPDTLSAHLYNVQQRRTSSLLPLYDGRQVENINDRQDVVAVGRRRPSVLSAGNGLGPEIQGAIGPLPIRRVSAGGVEDVVIIHGPGSQFVSLAGSDRRTDSRPPVPPLPLDLDFERRRKSLAPPSPHPFSARSLSRTSTTQVPVPVTQRARPESLTLVPFSPPHGATSAPTMSTDAKSLTKSALSTRAIKSPTTLTSAWSVSDNETPTPITGGLFEAWKGFPPKANAKATLRSHSSSVPVPTLNVPNDDPQGGALNDIAPLPASAGVSLTIPVEGRRSSTLSTSSRNSRITYLTEVVKDEANAREHGRKSIVSEYAPVIPFPRDVDPSAQGEIGRVL